MVAGFLKTNILFWERLRFTVVPKTVQSSHLTLHQISSNSNVLQNPCALSKPENQRRFKIINLCTEVLFGLTSGY